MNPETKSQYIVSSPLTAGEYSIMKARARKDLERMMLEYTGTGKYTGPNGESHSNADSLLKTLDRFEKDFGLLY